MYNYAKVVGTVIGYIYLTRNTVNDILCIGKRQKPKFEKCYKGSGTHLKLAFAKYGKDKFFTEIIERCDTIQQLNEAEKKWIKFYRDSGAELYNIAEGGDGGNCIDWSKMPEEKKRQMIEKDRASHIGKKYAPLTEEHKQKIRAKTLHRIRSETEIEREKATKRKGLLPVLQFDIKTGKPIRRWANWCEAGDSFRAEHGRCAFSKISECCRGKRKSAYGFAWRLDQEAVV